MLCPTFSLSDPSNASFPRSASGGIQAAGGNVEIVRSRVPFSRFVDGTVFLGPLKVGQVPPLF
jgi:hypothetical protein